MTASHRTEQWITHLVWIGRSDDPCKVARSLVKQLALCETCFMSAENCW
jgi:hypothetical protein